MQPRYYARRRLNPYRGVVQIIEVEDAMAHSYDGLTWHLRADDGYGWVRPTGVWLAGEGLKAGVRLPDALRAALEAHPPLPFALADQCELWLLDKERGLPLALLAASPPSTHRHARIDPEWQPFVLTYSAFRSPALARRELPGHGNGDRHRDWLARAVNNAARPYPAAQWFRRQTDGSGVGLGGLRLEKDWQQRALPADAFPDLPVRSTWNNPLERSVINDYHSHLAPLLLLLPGLADATREALEEAACLQVQRVARIHRLIPRVLRPERLNAALVAARLEAAAGQGPDGLLDS